MPSCSFIRVGIESKYQDILCRRISHRNGLSTQLEVSCSSDPANIRKSSLWVDEMTIEDFFCKCQGTLEYFPNFVDFLDQQSIRRSYGSTVFLSLRDMSRKEPSERTGPSANSWKHVSLSPSPSMVVC